MNKTLLVLALVLVAASPASAAEQQTLTRESPTATFQGKTGIGAAGGSTTPFNEQFPCLPESLDCETTLVRLDAPGQFLATTTPDPDLPEVYEYELRLFRSDAAGSRGPEVAAKSTKNRVAHDDLPAGFYLLLVKWWEGAHSYTGRLELTPHPEA